MSGLAAPAFSLSALTPLDYVLLLVLLYSTVRGFMMGAISELGLLVALAIGVVVASRFAHNVGGPLASLGVGPRWQAAIGYAVVLALIWIAVRIVTRVLRRGARLLMLGWLDRLGGAAFGLLRGLLIVVVVAFLIVHFRVTPFQADAHASPLVQAVSGLFPTLTTLLPHTLPTGPIIP